MIDPRDFGALESKVDQLEKMVEAQGAKIDQLLEIANKGKGALWLTLAVGGFLGSLATFFLKYIAR